MSNSQTSNTHLGDTYYPLLDIAKFIFACMVVAIHDSPFSSYSTFLGAAFNQIFARLAVPFFFAVSGFLLFRKDTFSTISNERMFHFLSRILVLLGTWKIICWDVDFHLWYLCATVIGGILIFVFSSLKVSIHRVFVVALFLFLIGLFRNTYYHYLESMCSGSILWRIFNSSLFDFLFGDGRNGLCCGFLFMMIGVEFSELKIRLPKVTFGILFLFCFAIYAVEVLIVHFSSASHSVPDYYAMALPTCFCLLGFLTSFRVTSVKKSIKRVSLFRVSSAIMFFIHPVIIKLYFNFFSNSLVNYLCVIASCFLFSLFIWYIENRTHSLWFRLLY